MDGKGIFPPGTARHGPPSLKRREAMAKYKRPDQTARIDRERLDALAEMMAEGMTITAASARLGVSMQRGSQLFKRIREELGWQAI